MRHHESSSLRPVPRLVALVSVALVVAWVTTSTDFVGTFEDRPVDFLGLETMVLNRQPEGWRIKAIHWSSRNRLPQN